MKDGATIWKKSFFAWKIKCVFFGHGHGHGGGDLAKKKICHWSWKTLLIEYIELTEMFQMIYKLSQKKVNLTH